MSYEQFNLHQQDLRGRVDSFAKAVFILAGGALTISIGLFVNKVELTSYLNAALKTSWWSLFTTIISLTLMQFTTITRDYFLGERWRNKLAGESDDASGAPGKLDAVIWVFGIIGLISFILGMLLMAYVATGVINGI